MSSDFASVEELVEAIGRGDPVVLVDDEDRENEGDLIMAADAATEEWLAFIIRHSSGVVCVPMEGDRCDELQLTQMVADNTESHGTAFTVSVDSATGVTTGISAADRTRTIRMLADPATRPADLNRPGHVFPLRARPGGVLKRAGHTEAAVDLAHLAGRAPVGLLCEVVNPDGTMARLDSLRVFCAEHDLLLGSIADLVRYRRQRERLVEEVSRARIPTPMGEFTAVVFRNTIDGEEHLALVHGDPQPGKDVLVRIHSECLTGDLFGSLRCDCGPQLHTAMELIGAAGEGVVLYLRGHEGRGIGLGHKLRAYALQEGGMDTVDANTSLGLPVDNREYGIGAQILAELGATRIRLMTNNPAKYGGLDGFGIEIVERVPLETAPTEENLQYLLTKRDRMGHILDLPTAGSAG